MRKLISHRSTLPNKLSSYEVYKKSYAPTQMITFQKRFIYFIFIILGSVGTLEFYRDLNYTQKIIENTLGEIFLKINFWWSEGPMTGPGLTLGEDNISTNTTENDDTTMERRP